MILQPVLENATIHGVSPGGVSLVKVHFEHKEQKLICRVEDNGAGIKETTAKSVFQTTEKRSKGNILVAKKIQMLNTLHHLNLEMQVFDRSVTEQQRGTAVVFTMNIITPQTTC